MDSWQGRIRARPGASRVRVGGCYGPDSRLLVAVHEPAADGRANRAVIAALAEALSLRSRQLSVAAGRGSRNKTIRVDAPPADISQRWQALLDG